MSVPFPVVEAVEDLAAVVARLAAAVDHLVAAQPADGYRVPAAARRIGVSEAQLRRLVADGVVRKVPHLGDVVVIAQAEIDRIMSAGVAA